MSALEIARLIPAHDRKQILEDNIVAIAKPDASDLAMHFLTIVWKVYIEPGFVNSCPACLQRVLDNYKQLLPLLVDLEKESNLLNAVN